MIPKYTFMMCAMSLSAFGQLAPSTDTAAVINLVPTLNFLNLLDGPSSISHGQTTPTTNSIPTLTQMKYYNNYAAAMYCQDDLDDLSCTPCQQFVNDVYDHTGSASASNNNFRQKLTIFS